MKDQPNIFFVVLTGSYGSIAVNIADILYVKTYDKEGRTQVQLRDKDGTFLLCSETPDEVAQKIDQAVRKSLTGFASAVMDLARTLR